MRAIIPGLLTGLGFLVCVTAFYPIAPTDWLPRSLQLLIGVQALLVGVGLVHLTEAIERAER